ncbi:hypothetical protein EIN_223930 [Entamoeba invadens IP1]|uniref:Uncharacterized protein n=1 Tax=Entamoeba invadens IP1 TaxID=370355 RepID=A0A0A1U5N6_ENTIV|nr:hypothetical protein EIN_223930 [Entamoeba invadens IP1]ELP88170.1 hypothetical protein EIN_223930 [Entamoeba invadens IP1]|eukprot:XP_004254941.1 hypothetical protein EIN_223930 [Entamoeba invadens IP1]
MATTPVSATDTIKVSIEKSTNNFNILQAYADSQKQANDYFVQILSNVAETNFYNSHIINQLLQNQHNTQDNQYQGSLEEITKLKEDNEELKSRVQRLEEFVEQMMKKEQDKNSQIQKIIASQNEKPVEPIQKQSVSPSVILPVAPQSRSESYQSIPQNPFLI